MSNLNSPHIFWLSFSKYHAFVKKKKTCHKLELNLSFYLELVSLHTLPFKSLG